ncbi:maleylpyruvate isomerase N-terminal domain-containing protein [Paenarthrobacter ureafaciens]|uniref:maleylpyruvate isomerase N-terminal domain-containing protein n=1 Tax=Paenarthrobacter ureafaciens TaxID=37931 RepID=UPI0035713AC4
MPEAFAFYITPRCSQPPWELHLATDRRLQEDLLQARRGTAFFARKLNELSDEELDGGTRLPGWTRRHLVAHVGYNARAIARLIEWAGTGVETPMYSSPRSARRGNPIRRHALPDCPAEPVRPLRCAPVRGVAGPSRRRLVQRGPHRARAHGSGVGNGMDANPRSEDARRRLGQRRHLQ